MIKTAITALCLALMSNAAAAQPGLVEAARERVGITLVYDPAYVRLSYPGGDVPADRGVCTDVVIRAYRAAYGYDLQAAVHDDMAVHFNAYPAHWGLKKPDKNIDHRRVPNLETFFKRRGGRLPLSEESAFKAGDLVTWRIGGRLPHIGIVSDKTAADGTPLILHNMGWGTKEENILHRFPKTAHFRFKPAAQDD
ncbi:MAG: DUF1287 domain-containing protein [Pseudomonadota bacterium]